MLALRMVIGDSFVRRQAIYQTAHAALISAAIARTTDLGFLIPFAVLVFNWPITTVIVEAIATRAPAADQRVVVTSWWPPIVTAGIVLILSSTAWIIWDLRFFNALAYTVLIVTAAGALNSIILEGEDTAPGGWDNPAPPGKSTDDNRRA